MRNGQQASLWGRFGGVPYYSYNVYHSEAIQYKHMKTMLDFLSEQ